MLYEPILMGSLVICTRCRDSDPSRSPVFPSWLTGRHDAWHEAQDRAASDEPVLERAS